MALMIKGIGISAVAKGAAAKPAKASTKSGSIIANAAKAVVGKNALAAAAAAKAKASEKSRNNNPNNRKPTGSSGTPTPSGGAATSSTTTAQPDPEKNVLIKWHDVEFYANANEVRGLLDFTIGGSVETEDKEEGGTKYVRKKNSKGYESGLTAFFDRRLGIESVKEESMKLVNYAANGQTGYLYARESKLVPSIMMLTSAKASKIIMSPNGTWISCQVTLTLKTCSKLDGSGGGGGGGGGSGYKFGCTVYYSGSSGAIQSVWAGSNVSKDDARKKAWAKVPKTAMWASETKKQATNQSPKLTDAALEAARKRVAEQSKQTEAAKTQSQNSGTGITNRNNQVQQKKLLTIMKKDVR